MELRRLTMVNWHLFDAEDIEVWGNFGILGENRSGKSTILDMVQVVLSGASRTYLRLNAVAGESGRGRSSSKRSVLGYCLGTLGDGETRRQEALTYVALGFEDPDGIRPPITIGLALEARSTDTSETVLGRFVVTGKLLTTTDFTEQRPDGRYTAAWDDVKARIVADVGAANFINHREKATDFVREYMRRLVPSLPNAEQSAAALLKAVVNAMSLNQGYSATEFVRRFILEDNPIRIGELRSSIETYRGVSATIVTMRRKLEALKGLREHITTFAETLDRRALEDWLARRARWLAARAANRAVREEIAAARWHIEAEREDKDLALEGIREADQEIQRLMSAIAMHAAKSGRDQWEQNLKHIDDQSAMAHADIRRRLQLATALVPLTRVVPEGDILGAFCDAAAAAVPNSDQRKLREAERAVREVAPAILGRIEALRRQISAEIVTLDKEVTELRQALEQARERGSAAYLGNETRLLMRRLESSGMDARPLCDLVEIIDPEWVAAAEALLGRDREAIFVERRHIRDATAVFREGRREYRGASLVSLNKLEEFREVPKPGTFPSLFRTQDPDAMAFLQRRYGNVRLARTLDEFNLPGRALMQDGLYDDGLVRSHRVIEARDHKIGKAAQADRFRHMQDAFTEKAERLSKLRQEEKVLDRAMGALADVTQHEDGTWLSDMLVRIYGWTQERIGVVERIDAIDAQGDGGLRERLKVQQDFLRRKKAQLEAIQDRTREYEVAILSGERTLKAAESTDGSEMNLKLAQKLYGEERKLFAYCQGAAAYRERMVAARKRNAHAVLPPAEYARQAASVHRKVAYEAAEASERVRDLNHRAELAARGALRDYFNEFGVSGQVGPESSLLKEVKPWMDLLIEDIEGNELRRYEDRAREAAERASTLFRGEFVNALNMRVSKMERDLEALNRSLRDHPFHNERYSFHRTAEAEFHPVLKVIEISRISDDALDMLFRADVPDDFPHKDTIKAVEQLLEDPDKDFSSFEDYRNFYAFEIHMEDIHTKARTRWETRRGTGSGAEQQVPLYVAIGASLAAVYGSGGNARGRPKGMSPALFDEAFSKMDGKNQRAMMAFYEDLGLQVVVAAPLEKKAAIMGYMETLVEVDRIGEQSTTDVIHVGRRAREEILAMNPEHLTDEQIAGLIAAE
ncbi:SbcC/MukB-like Walker B domain-containing protein [Microvirga sp. KLBC 81]|uniref:SbcC/MukB-like Walker B domain-containing protein n=1 Tax=Microvirga sp. KLBC 81 TaxID=1862707 RepID=UPI001FDED97F|nr:SbcC/MukB-like Walker B domain-containing protein [Microvirga sp. KLBC 81]